MPNVGSGWPLAPVVRVRPGLFWVGSDFLALGWVFLGGSCFGSKIMAHTWYVDYCGPKLWHVSDPWIITGEKLWPILACCIGRVGSVFLSGRIKLVGSSSPCSTPNHTIKSFIIPLAKTHLRSSKVRQRLYSSPKHKMTPLQKCLSNSKTGLFTILIYSSLETATLS